MCTCNVGTPLNNHIQLIQESLNRHIKSRITIRHLILAIPVVAAASAGLIALPITLNRLQLTSRQTQAEEEGLITDRINAAVLGLGAEKTVKFEDGRKIVERTVANIEVRIGSFCIGPPCSKQLGCSRARSCKYGQTTLMLTR